ncbi:MAG: two-component system cell cycle response regulator PopA [Hyphomonadaceae bacterium]|nr:MAG: two-component system cell cycle response regulator PopA [Hyphomonadaceae bacterium]
MKPNILVLGGDQACEAILAAGYPITGVNDLQAPAAAIVIDVRSGGITKSYEIMEALKLALGPRAGLFFAWTDETPDVKTYRTMHKLGFDGSFNAQTPIAFISARLESAIRIQTMSDEVQSRMKTLESFGAPRFGQPTLDKNPRRVLIYGPPCPENMRLAAMLETLGVATIAAMSSYTAFDYLHKGNFDAIIVISKGDSANSIAFCAALRRNSRLFHLPCLLFAASDFESLEVAISRGASDAVRAGENDELALARLLTLIDEKRRRDALNLIFHNAKTTNAIDRRNGIYNQDFFNRHLLEIVERSTQSRKNVALALVDVTIIEQSLTSKSPEAIRKVINQCANMLSRLIRIEDVAAILDNGKFAVIFPSTPAQTAETALARIVAVLESSGFDTGAFTEPASVNLQYEVIELEENQSSDEFMARFGEFMKSNHFE